MRNLFREVNCHVSDLTNGGISSDTPPFVVIALLVGISIICLLQILTGRGLQQ